MCLRGPRCEGRLDALPPARYCWITGHRFRGPTRRESFMPLVQLVYASRPFGFDQATLSNLLLDSRRANARDDITGALIARHDLYLQLLEGPEQKVEDVYERILNDDRHVDVVKLVDRRVETRLF